MFLRTRAEGRFEEKRTDPRQFDHVVLRLAEGGTAIWLDAADGCPFGTLAPSSRVARGVQVGAEGGTVVDIASGSPQSSREVATQASLDRNGTLEGTALASLPADEYPAALVSGGTKGEAIACWSRPSTAYPGLYDLVAQKLVSGGVVAAPPAPAALALSAPWPNPASDGWTVSFRLSAPGEAVLELFDVAGRRVERLRVRVDDAAPRQVRFAAGALAPGVYRVRLSCAAGERTRVVVLAR